MDTFVPWMVIFFPASTISPFFFRVRLASPVFSTIWSRAEIVTFSPDVSV